MLSCNATDLALRRSLSFRWDGTIFALRRDPSLTSADVGPVGRTTSDKTKQTLEECKKVIQDQVITPNFKAALESKMDSLTAALKHSTTKLQACIDDARDNGITIKGVD